MQIYELQKETTNNNRKRDTIASTPDFAFQLRNASQWSILKRAELKIICLEAMISVASSSNGTTISHDY